MRVRKVICNVEYVFGPNVSTGAVENLIKNIVPSTYRSNSESDLLGEPRASRRKTQMLTELHFYLLVTCHETMSLLTETVYLSFPVTYLSLLEAWYIVLVSYTKEQLIIVISTRMFVVYYNLERSTRAIIIISISVKIYWLKYRKIV
jgi:hypothetical protein